MNTHVNRVRQSQMLKVHHNQGRHHLIFLRGRWSYPLLLNLEKMATHLLKTKLNQSADGKTAIYKTGGPKLVVVQRHQPRVATITASRSTIRKRSNYLQKQRDRISMGSCGTQQQDEIKIAAKQQRIDQLFAKIPRVSISSEELLAVKSDLGITWNSNRKLKRWFNHWGVRSGGEQQMRRHKESIIGDNLVAKNLPFLFTEEKGRIEKLAPCVYADSLPRKVLQQLDENDRLNLLSWHGGKIPQDEVWVKLGGDKGGGSFKAMFQLGNVLHPNAKQNTVVFCFFESGDTFQNLSTALDRFREQLQELRALTWK
ncbi:uncharacterized protein [Ptychodera flava]|uniref:uncharacterized protein n=1 Tax=Ptychodera flava TaxID=63121 RepID=UPI00396A24A5